MKEKHKNDTAINAILEKYGLFVGEDVFEKHTASGKLMYRIINRQGIDKVEAIAKKEGLELDWKIISADKDHAYIDIWAKKNDGGELVTFHTTGEASVHNVKLNPPYILSMAQARAKSRAILGIEGLYSMGFMGEFEADEFMDFVRDEQMGGKISKKKSSDNREIEDLMF